jgi:hypothetical protein
MILESLPFARESIDRTAGVIRGVKILGRESKNGYSYNDKALNEAKSLYDNAPVYLNHPDRKEAGKERRIEEGFGQIQNPVVKADGVYGDIHYLTTHPHASQIAERAERMPASFGLSQNAVGSVTPGKNGGKGICESVTKVHSVDIVTSPATTKGLFESFAGETISAKDLIDSVKRDFPENESAKLVSQLLEAADYRSFAQAPAQRPTPPMAGSPMPNGQLPGAGEIQPDPAAEAVKEAIKALVSAIIDGTDTADVKLSKIAKFLGIMDPSSEIDTGDMDETDTTDPATDNLPPGKGKKMTATTGKPDPMQESVNSLATELKQLRRDGEVRDLCESLSIDRLKLTADQRKQLREATDETACRTILEALPPAMKLNVKKPEVSALRESIGETSYDDIAKDVRPRKRSA